jgi:hypothetical protein
VVDGISWTNIASISEGLSREVRAPMDGLRSGQRGRNAETLARNRQADQRWVCDVQDYFLTRNQSTVYKVLLR